MQKIFKWMMMGLGIIVGGAFVTAVGIGMATSFDNSLGTDVSDGYATCPVSSMEVGYALNTPPKTRFAKVTCGDGPWEWAWFSSGRSDEWQQPQALLDATKIGDLFICERYRKKSFTGWQETVYLKRCTKA